jgi:hypothetical protein
MRNNEDKPIALPLPTSVTDFEERGGPSERALAEYQRRLEAHQPAQAGAAENNGTTRRRELIAGIYAMDRSNAIAAAEGFIGGAIAGAVVQVLFLGIRHWYDSRTHRPPEPLTARSAAPSGDDAKAVPGGAVEGRPVHPAIGGAR